MYIYIPNTFRDRACARMYMHKNEAAHDGAMSYNQVNIRSSYVNKTSMHVIVCVCAHARGLLCKPKLRNLLTK